MTAKKALFRAVSYLWLGSIIGAGCAFLTQVILARGLGPEEFGVFAAALGTVTMLAPLAGFGISQYWLKVFGHEGWLAMRWLKGSFRFIGVSTVTVLLLLLIWARLGPHDALSATILLVLSCHVLGQLAVELVSSKLQLEERYLNLAFWQALPHLSRLIVVVVLAYGATNLLSAQAAAYSYAAVALVFFVGAVRLSSRLYRGAFALKGHQPLETSATTSKAPVPGMFQVAARSWPFGVAGLFHLIYFQSDIILLRYMTGAEVAGVYNVAFTVMVAVYLLPGVIYQKFLLPKIHRWAHHDRARFYQVYRQGNVAMLILGIFAMTAIWLLAPWGVVTLFGRSYHGAVGLLMILAVSAPILFLASSVGATLVTREHMKSKVQCMGMVAGINIVLNILLIPPYGALGAAVATVISNLALLAIYYFYAEKLVFSDLEKGYKKVNV
jgi:O-antigen/teichoic acid export membrane protein